MKLTLMIAGREAVPVRAIPLLSYWENLSPDEVARALARHEGFENFADLAAYRLESGEPREVDDASWEHYVVRKIEDLELQDLDTEQWQEKSIATLPAWAFVWRDDLVRCYLAEYGWNDDGEPAELAVPLNFNPMVPPEFASLVMEAFDALGAALAVSDGASASIITSTQSTPSARTAGGRKSWWTYVSTHVVDVQRRGRFSEAKTLYRQLTSLAAEDASSPFRVDRGELVLKATNKPVALKTVQNSWPDIRKLADET